MPHRPRHRPPWWPVDEPWPPPPSGWRRDHGAFLRLIALLAGLLLVLFVSGSALSVWLAARGLGSHGHVGRFAFAVSAALIISGVLATARAARKVAVPVGGWLEAAERVEAGDYSVRVPEQGPPALRRLTRAFNAMTERLEADEARRRRLLADVTHELRTPLTIIQGEIEGILDGVYPADDAHLTPILEETRVLARLIDDLRTLSLAEAGALTLHREPTDLGVLAGEVAAAFRGQAQTAGVALDIRLDDTIPLLEVDPIRLREVLSNLLANALRYTPPGGVVTVEGRTEGQSVSLTVRDTGAGIAPEALPHIFDRFYRSSESRGSGLGLAIARNLVEAHGGAIGATSAPGTGTAIEVRLPLDPKSPGGD